ncbi:MAG: threonine synthase [Pseudomonadota bacterium]
MNKIRFCSTNKNAPDASFSEAALIGQPKDQGLYFPTTLPQLEMSELEEFADRPFSELAFYLTGLWIGGELPESVWMPFAERAFNFPVKLREIDDARFVLELFHGPTLSFKDVGARFLAGFLDAVLNSQGKTATILTATSGDTGSAVADAFAGHKTMRTVVLYPKGQISLIQEHQIALAREGVRPIAVNGTFDDCQALVKGAMADPELAKINPTSANSINVGRLIPQSFLFVYAALAMSRDGSPIVVSVPCGNFGNLTAGLIAKFQGAPIEFISATNVNDVVSRYFKTGHYEPRKSVRTLSSAMDVGNPSNLARIRHLFNDDVNEMRKTIFPVAVSDEVTLATIREVHARTGYLLDPHGAVAWEGASQWRRSVKGHVGPVISLETAHPAKFPDAAERATGLRPEIPDMLSKQLAQPMASEGLENDPKAFKEYLLDFF